MVQAKRLWVVLSIIAVSVFIFSCQAVPVSRTEKPAPETPSLPGPSLAAAGRAAGPPPPSSPPAADYLTIVAAGDNLFHEPILNDFYRGNQYNFEPIYEFIKPYIEKADIAFVNQETVLGTSDYSGYPLFNTPREAGAALVSAGFDVVNHATNHIMDRGEEGIRSTIDYWKTVPEISRLGIHASEEERKKNFCIIEKNNIRTGFLSYTYGTNYIPLPRLKSYLVSVIDTDKMAKEIDELRTRCDFLVVSMHWGNEYKQTPSAAQEKLAAFLAEHKVDLVIGHHPHVLQPMARIKRPDGGEMLVYYSLGNFVSAHVQPDKPCLMGGLMYIRLKKTGADLRIETQALIPLITHYEKNLRGFRIYPLGEYTEDLAQQHWRRTVDSGMKPEYFLTAARDLFNGDLMLYNPFN
jgi:poly-gamma-glutamate synthesis protein (capsule biosynthesis protein)